MQIYDINTFPYFHLYDYPLVRNHNTNYINIEAAFDIETTNIYCEYRKTCELCQHGKCPGRKCPSWVNPVSFMYHWQMCIHNDVVFGRTWEEYLYFVKKIGEMLELGLRKRLVVYVHNLAFEFQFLKSHFNFTEVFARKERQPIKAYADGIEYRCSYILSNMSLQKFCENTPNVTHGKLKGNLDYDKIRTSKTLLTREEQEYCYNDVKGLCECIAHYLKEDSICSIPLTSTGFVRRDCRNAMKKNPRNKINQKKNALNLHLYNLLKEAFRGGNTHANYYYANEKLEGVKSKDIASSYPYVLMVKKYPTKFIRENPKNINRYRNNPDFSFLAKIRLKNVRYIGKCNIPYIAISKCLNEKDSDGRLIKKGIVSDNGRVLRADQIVLTVTNIDFEIILREYKADKIEISEFYVSRNKYLPKELREQILKYFKLKSELKWIAGKEYEYMKSKNKLNGIYGMMVTDIVMSQIEYINNEWRKADESSDEEKSAVISKYYSNPNTFLSYQVGIWVTAYARENLQKALEAVGSDVVYCDTDSVKYLGDHEVDFARINGGIMKEIEDSPLKPEVVVGKKTYYMGLYEDDGEYIEFKTLGAKKYATKYIKDGEIKYKTTVAGLGVKEGSAYIKTNGIDAFKIETVFYPSGRLNVYYNDDSTVLTINNETIHTGSNVCMMPGTYILGITDDYNEILTNKFSPL